MKDKLTFMGGVSLLILAIFFCTVAITCISYGIVAFTEALHEKAVTDSVDCYDRYGHKILDQTCVKTSFPKQEEAGAWMILAAMMSVFTGMTFAGAVGLLRRGK